MGLSSKKNRILDSQSDEAGAMPANPTKNMQECYYCQDGVEDAQAFTISAPDKTSVCVCATCMDDLKKFFKSGEADERHSSPDESGSRLDIVKNHLAEKEDGKVIKVFENVIIQRVNHKIAPSYQLRRGRFDVNGPYGYYDPWDKAFQTEKVLEIEAMILDSQPS